MIKMIMACDNNNCIGKGNSLLEHIPEDLAYFKKVTSKGNVIMGNNTFKSLPFYPKGLPNRNNRIITRTPPSGLYRGDVDYWGDCTIEGIKRLTEVYRELEEDVWVIGGAQVYKMFEEFVEEVHITRIDKVYMDEGDSSSEYTFVNLDFLVEREFKKEYSETLNDFCKVEAWKL